MTEMIERVAKAIFASDMKWLPVLEHQFEENKIVYLNAASAAIEAMREPTNPMVDAANAVGAYWHHDTCEFVSEWREEMRQEYRAMIDAAIAQSPQEGAVPHE